MKRDTSALTSRPNALRRAAETLGGWLGGLVRPLLKDKLSSFLLLASIALAIAFFTLLGSTKPSSPGEAVALSTVIQRAEDKQLLTGVLLDYDSRIVVTTHDGRELWAAYPSSDAQLNALITTLREGGAVVVIDQQSSKPITVIVVQFLIPILLLVCLFALFTRLGADGGAGGIASFSDFKGKGRKRGAKSTNRVTFDDVAGAGESVVELREIRDFLEDPSRYLTLGAAPPKGVQREAR